MWPRWSKIEFYSEVYFLQFSRYENGLFNNLLWWQIILSIIPDFPAQGILELCFAEVKKTHSLTCDLSQKTLDTWRTLSIYILSWDRKPELIMYLQQQILNKSSHFATNFNFWFSKTLSLWSIPGLKDPSQLHLCFYLPARVWLLYLFGACRNEGNHCETTKDN